MTNKSTFDGISVDLERDNLDKVVTLDAVGYQIAADIVEQKLARMIEDSRKSEQEREIEERLSADSIGNMQRHYEDTRKKVERFGKEIIRTIAAEYIIRHNKTVGDMFKVDTKYWSVEQRLKLSELEIPYHDWRFLDNQFVAYLPGKANDIFAEEPKPVVFSIPYNFLPSLFNWAATLKEIEKELSDNSEFGTISQQNSRINNSVKINIGVIEIDPEALFKNFYLARTAGTGALRIPFVIKAIPGREAIHFSVRVEMKKTKHFSNNQDILLDKLIDLSRASTKQVVTDVNDVLDKIYALQIAQRHLQDSIKSL